MNFLQSFAKHWKNSNGTAGSRAIKLFGNNDDKVMIVIFQRNGMAANNEYFHGAIYNDINTWRIFKV